MTLMEDLLLKGYIDKNIDDIVKSASADYLVRLLTFCAKSDGSITSEERDYIIDYIETFDINDGEETWLFAQYDFGRFNEYNRDTILLLRESIEKLPDKKNLDYKILDKLLSISLINNEYLNDTQNEIIVDYINIFQLNPNKCDKIYNNVLKEKNKVQEKNVNNLDECYKALGLDKNCSENDLKKRYAYLTKNYHPDKYNLEEMPAEIRKELEDTYKKINLAYDKLREKF